MRNHLPLILPALALTLATSVLAGTPDPRPEASASGEPAADAAGDASAAAAMRVFRDPDTGRLGPPPEGYRPGLTEERLPALSTDARALREEPSPVAGGGFMVDLQGRFQSVLQATVGADGELTTGCDHGLDHGVDHGVDPHRTDSEGGAR